MTAVKVAYFSMEIALWSDVPNYAGGLGVLAADMMHSFADLDYPAVGVSLIYHQDDDLKKGFNPETVMKRVPEMVEVTIENRQVKVGAFVHQVKGISGKTVPIYFLTTNLSENPRWDRDLTKDLYASSNAYTRLGQEVILGIGGVRMLRKLGYATIENFHMNEGHSAFLTLERLKEEQGDVAAVKKSCTFTTHTPVPEGHDHFDYVLVYQVLGSLVPANIRQLATDQSLSMTHLALNLSKATNSVSEVHHGVCERMFQGYSFQNVTNGIHLPTWVSDPIRELFQQHFPSWEQEPNQLEQLSQISLQDELLAAHRKNKQDLIDWINVHQEFFPAFDNPSGDDGFDDETLTIAFARRFVAYKRPSLIFQNLQRLRELGYRKIQIIFAGKCHPSDESCAHLRADVRHYAEELRGQVKIALIPDYSPDIARKLVCGADLWLNAPIRSREASGTSGMKAALNGLLNLSTWDGWWVEGFARHPEAGWGFGDHSQGLPDDQRDQRDAEELYVCLEDIVDCYYDRPEEWLRRMQLALALAGYFNTSRCIGEYEERLWGVGRDNS